LAWRAFIWAAIAESVRQGRSEKQCACQWRAGGSSCRGNNTATPLIGAAIGAAIGGGIGYALDRQQAELEQALERERATQQATVERVGDDQLEVTISDEVAFDYKSTAIRPDFLPTVEHVADVLAKYDSSSTVSLLSAARVG
jgi:outer membrane protein OmpA-like peptidoglycan-associated protein